MQIAIVGLAGSGKTTVFNTLTRGHAQTGGYGGMELHVGMSRSRTSGSTGWPRSSSRSKIVHADVTYFDLPAPPRIDEGRVGTEELPADQLARLREADALLHVVRAFDDPGGAASRRVRSTPGATSSAWTSSSSWPTCR